MITFYKFTYHRSFYTWWYAICGETKNWCVHRTSYISYKFIWMIYLMGSVLFELKAMSIFDLISQSLHFNLHVANCNLFLPMLKWISVIAVQPYQVLQNVWVLHQHIRNFEVGWIVSVALAKRKETRQQISFHRESDTEAQNVVRLYVCEESNNKIQLKQMKVIRLLKFNSRRICIRFVALLSIPHMCSTLTFDANHSLCLNVLNYGWNRNHLIQWYCVWDFECVYKTQENWLDQY